MLFLQSDKENQFPVTKIQDRKMPKLSGWLVLQRNIAGEVRNVYMKKWSSGSYFIMGDVNYYIPDPEFKNEDNFVFVEGKSNTKHRPKVECFSKMDKGFRGELAEVEANDCTVFSTAKAFNVDYSLAHHVCAAFGRTNKRGMMFNDTLRNPEFGARFGKKIIRDREYDGKTVHTFLNENTKGIYFVIIHRHVFAVVNGVVHDAKFWNRSKIHSLYQVHEASQDS